MSRRGSNGELMRSYRVGYSRFGWIPDLESERLLNDSTKDAPTSVLMAHASSFRGRSILLVLLARNVLCREDNEIRHQ